MARNERDISELVIDEGGNAARAKKDDGERAQRPREIELPAAQTLNPCFGKGRQTLGARAQDEENERKAEQGQVLWQETVRQNAQCSKKLPSFVPGSGAEKHPGKADIKQGQQPGQRQRQAWRWSPADALPQTAVKVEKDDAQTMQQNKERRT